MSPLALYALDTETDRVQPGLAAPPLVCVSTATAIPGSERVEVGDAARASAALAIEAAAAGELTLGGHTIDYDFVVLAADRPELLEAIFRAVERGAVVDAAILERLHRIATGTDDDKQMSNALAALEQRLLGIDRSQEKENGWRLQYHQLRGKPLSEWPEEAIQYPRRDARGTLDVLQKQLVPETVFDRAHDFGVGGSTTPSGPDDYCNVCGKKGRDFEAAGFAELPCTPHVEKRLNIHCAAQEMRAALFLRLGSVWGMRTDPEMVEHVTAEISRKHEESRRKFFAAGIVRVRTCVKKDGEYETADDITADTLDELEAMIPDTAPWAAERLTDIEKCRRARKKDPARPLRFAESRSVLRGYVTEAYQGDPPMTEGGEQRGPEVKIDRDTLEESGDKLLEDYGEAGVNEKLHVAFSSVLRQGAEVPICFGFNPTLSTQRVSLFEPNLSQLPRKGPVRECFVPRGYVYVEDAS
jgi:DNA polymerase I